MIVDDMTSQILFADLLLRATTQTEHRDYMGFLVFIMFRYS